MAALLNSSETTITPLNHHFAALAALTLRELSAFDETKEEAQQALEEIERAVVGRKGLMAREDSQGWDSAVRELVSRARSGAAEVGKEGEPGLHDLANAAVSGRGKDKTAKSPVKSGGTAREAFDPTALTKYGYLAALVREER